MEQMREQVRPLVEKALQDARAKHGRTFASWHEAYGVLSEEVMEVRQELRMLETAMDDLMNSIHGHDDVGIQQDLSVIFRHAELAACEAIQVAAVVAKAKNQNGGA